MSKVSKYNYEEFTDVEKQIFVKAKELRQLICDNCPEADYISLAMLNHNNGYISITVNSDKKLPDGHYEDDIISCTVWDKEGIEDEETNTEE